MKFLITGGAGFIGRWVVKKLLEEGQELHVFDNLSSGSRHNLEEFAGNETLRNVIVGDITDRKALHQAFAVKPDVCIHLAAQINVQESIDHPERSFDTNVLGTYNVMEEARHVGAKVVVVGTCMVYDTSSETPINERHPAKPMSPYAATKLAAEQLALSYYHCYGLPVVIARPFNTYGPFQRTDAEGGVVAVFIRNMRDRKPLQIFGDGTQTRDLLYVDDCAAFITRAAIYDDAIGQVINAGTGKDVSINHLAELICSDKSQIVHVSHPHPQSEIKRLVCDATKARDLLGWKPRMSLEDGIHRTRRWIENGEEAV